MRSDASRVISVATFGILLVWLVIGNPIHLLGQGTHSNNLSWTAPTTGGAVATYNIKRSTTTGTETTIATVPSTQTTYVDTNGVAGTKYFYVVSASNQFGESANSNEVAATFLGDSPAAPTLLGVTSK
jgi:fibronectin type 3 domain-containing protein